MSDFSLGGLPRTGPASKVLKQSKKIQSRGPFMAMSAIASPSGISYVMSLGLAGRQVENLLVFPVSRGRGGEACNRLQRQTRRRLR